MSPDLPRFFCEAMNSEHEPSGFDCGHASSLSDWLINKALDHQNEDLARVWVLVDPERPYVPTAFFTLSAHSIQTAGVSKRDRRDDPKNGSVAGALPSHPALLLGKFAVDSAYQGKGVGDVLMMHVYDKYLDSLGATASRYLVLHAQEPALVKYYSEQFNFVRSPDWEGKFPVAMYKKTSSIRQEMARVRGAD